MGYSGRTHPLCMGHRRLLCGARRCATFFAKPFQKDPNETVMCTDYPAWVGRLRVRRKRSGLPAAQSQPADRDPGTAPAEAAPGHRVMRCVRRGNAQAVYDMLVACRWFKSFWCCPDLLWRRFAPPPSQQLICTRWESGHGISSDKIKKVTCL